MRISPQTININKGVCWNPGSRSPSEMVFFLALIVHFQAKVHITLVVGISVYVLPMNNIIIRGCYPSSSKLLIFILL